MIDRPNPLKKVEPERAEAAQQAQLDKEAINIVERYKRRHDDRIVYSVIQIHRTMSDQEKQRAFLSFLRDDYGSNIENLRILEIGVGYGANLMLFLYWGASPNNLFGIDIVKERCTQARALLPNGCKILNGDALKLGSEVGKFDIVVVSTVLSSIIDREFRKKLADKISLLVNDHGAILLYDFIFNNPNNIDVRKVTVSEAKELFPSFSIKTKRITLAPPIARVVCRISPKLYTFFNLLPFLRTHAVMWMKKR